MPATPIFLNYIKLRTCGDSGIPIVLQDTDSPISKTYIEIAEKISSINE